MRFLFLILFTAQVGFAQNTEKLMIIRFKDQNSDSIKVSEIKKITFPIYTSKYFGKIADIDGNIYNTVRIGNQEWTVENLRTIRYNDGTIIPNILDYSEWTSTTSGALCAYDNIQNNVSSFGYLYNGLAVLSNKLAPANGNWRVPTDYDWAKLENLVGGNSSAGSALKSQSGWNENGNGFDSFGFSALPGGMRSGSAGSFFSSINSSGFFWCSTPNLTTTIWRRSISFNTTDSYRWSSNKNNGFSVRLVRDLKLNVKPTAPSNSFPVDKNTYRKTSMVFSWNSQDEDGDSLFYDIYLGTEQYPIKAISMNQKNNSIQVSELKTSSTYYWRVVVRDKMGGVNESQIWSFNIMENKPPNNPSNFSPINDATNESVSCLFSWNCSDPDGDSLFYDLYFGTSIQSLKLVSENQRTTTFKIIGLLNVKKYYWKVVAKDDIGFETVSTINSFTTKDEILYGTLEYNNITYKTVFVMNQEWTIDNLRTTTYNDGSPIPHATEKLQWQSMSSAYCAYNNDLNNVSTYGYLYNSYAVSSGKLSPAGWRVPTRFEWANLASLLTGTDGTRLTIVTGGMREGTSGNASFINKNYGYWWSSTTLTFWDAYYIRLESSYLWNTIINTGDRRNGYSVRLVRDVQ